MITLNILFIFHKFHFHLICGYYDQWTINHVHNDTLFYRSTYINQKVTWKINVVQWIETLLRWLYKLQSVLKCFFLLLYLKICILSTAPFSFIHLHLCNIFSNENTFSILLICIRVSNLKSLILFNYTSIALVLGFIHW